MLSAFSGTVDYVHVVHPQLCQARDGGGTQPSSTFKEAKFLYLLGKWQ